MPVATLPTAAEVTALVSGNWDDAVVNAVIADAVLMIDNACFDAYAEDKKTSITKWVAAHMLASTGSDGTVTSEKLGDASISFARGTLGDGLKGTTQGQQALLLDTNGCLMQLGRAKATIEPLV